MDASNPPPAIESAREHLAALDVLRVAKNLFLWLLVLSAGLHVAAWLLVCHTDRLKPLKDRFAARAAPVDSDAVAGAERWKNAADAATSVAGFVGRASGLVLLALMSLSLLTVLTARAPGAASLARACVWSIAVVAMLVPWRALSPSEGVGFPSALCDASELHRLDNERAVAAAANGTGGAGSIVNGGETGALGGEARNGTTDRYFTVGEVLRFGGFPLLLIAVSLVAQWHYGAAYRAIAGASGVQLQVREL